MGNWIGWRESVCGYPGGDQGVYADGEEVEAEAFERRDDGWVIEIV